jgi:hypothetical protein
MNFFHRFAYYLVGLVVGIFCFLLYSAVKIRAVIIFKMRVLNDIRNKPFDYSEKASKVLAEKWIDTIDIKTH